MRQYLYIISLAFLCSCTPKSNTTPESATVDTNVVNPTLQTSPSAKNEEVITLPQAPEWLTEIDQYILDEWKDKAKYELYTFDEFCNTIPTMLNSYSYDPKHISHPIKTDREFTTLHEITTDSAIYVFASISAGSSFFYCWQRYSIKDNIPLFEESSPVIFLDSSDPSNDSKVDLNDFYLTNDGDFFFSIHIFSGGGEIGGAVDEYEITLESYGCENLEFHEKNGKEILWVRMSMESSTMGPNLHYLSGTNLNSTIEISKEDYICGFPIITKHTNEIIYGRDQETELDTTFTTIYKYDIERKEYKEEK